MSLNLDTIDKEGLRFYGKISASISHEMKNILAVINENAGLLEDLILMSKKGVSLNTERIESLAESMKKQVRRGDLIAQNLNRFAHSVDEFIKTVDLSEILDLVVSITRRFADMKGVTLNLRSAPGKIDISTYPFLLEHLLWCCLEMGITRAGEEKTININSDKMENGAQVTFSGLSALLSMPLPESFPGPREKALLDVLSAQMEISTIDDHIRIKLPQNIVT